MDPVVPSICLASLSGALLFYVGGRFSLRPAPAALPGGATPGADPSLPSPSPELEEERSARARAEEQASGAAAARDEAIAGLSSERARVTALTQELAAERDARTRADAEAARERRRLVEEAGQLRVQAAGAAGELATLRAHAHAGRDGVEAERARAQIGAAEARAAAAEGRAATLGGDLEKARVELAKARAELTKARAEGVESRHELIKARGERREAQADLAKARSERDQAKAELDGARAEAAKARAELAAREGDAGKKPAAELAEIQRANVEASMKLRALEQRAQGVARKEAENAELRRRVDALAAAAAEAEELRRRLRDLEAQGYARRAIDRPYEAEDVPASEGKPELEASISLGLRDLCAREEGCRAAVLSDTRGLLVAAYGDAGHRLELAAAASLVSATAERLRELLPLGAAGSVTLVDENDLVLRTRWLRIEDECLALSTLVTAPPAQDAAAEALRSQLFALIGAR